MVHFINPWLILKINEYNFIALIIFACSLQQSVLKPEITDNRQVNLQTNSGILKKLEHKNRHSPFKYRT